MLYNIWHGFSVRYRVLWQAVTLWLVNRAIAVVRVIRSNRCVTGRRPRDNYAVSFRQSQRIESRARDTQQIRGLGRLWRYSLHRGASVGTSLAPGRRYGTRRSPLSEYMSLRISLKLTTSCGTLSRIKWEIYFYKQVCFVRSLCLITIQQLYYKTDMKSVRKVTRLSNQCVLWEKGG